MKLIETIRARPLLFLAALAALSLGGLFLVPAILQPQDYHLFADRRTLLGIPNYWNVVSNIPFVIVGALGVMRVRGAAMRVFFLGVLLTGFSSSYYHWAPDDAGLFWDRLPMSIAFMAIFAAVVEERIDATAGTWMLWPLVVLGLGSLLVWRQTGDLRLYGWVQFFPCLVLPLIFLLLTPRGASERYWFAAAALYLLAKIFEYADAAIYAAGHVVSGHTLKHIAAAAAAYAIMLTREARATARDGG